MEATTFQEKLPQSTGVLVLGILSIVLSCCCSGIIGMILAVIALVMAAKAKKIYMEAPEQYTGYSNVSTGRILAIIGIIVNLIVLLISIYMIVVYGFEGIEEMQQEILREYGIEI